MAMMIIKYSGKPKKSVYFVRAENNKQTNQLTEVIRRVAEPLKRRYRSMCQHDTCIERV